MTSDNIAVQLCEKKDTAAICFIINESAQAYRGIIADDCWDEPYMSHEQLMEEINDGVRFSGWYERGALIGVMGIQKVGGMNLIRHAYVRKAHQGKGIGETLLKMLIRQTNGPVLVGAWSAAEWALRFYERLGFRLVPSWEKSLLLETYWKISEKQRDNSVVLVYQR